MIVRGKAGAKIEFGNTLFLAEQADGLIPDWKLYQDKVPADSKILKESIERLEKEYDNYTPKSVTTDRGFFSKTNQKFLNGKGIRDYMCPKSVRELKERLFTAVQATIGQFQYNSTGKGRQPGFDEKRNGYPCIGSIYSIKSRGNFNIKIRKT